MFMKLLSAYSLQGIKNSGGEKPTLRSEDHKAQKKATEKKN